MTTVVINTLSLIAFGGLSLVVIGVLPLGPRGVAALTLIGFTWVGAVTIRIGLYAAHR